MSKRQSIATATRLCRARDLITDCYAEPVSLADCAAEAGLSPWHLLRAFRTTFGETPKEYLTRLRLERAQHLLAATTSSVTDICFDIGFTSLGTFCTLFRRRFGCSPTAFRRRARRWVTVPGVLPWTFVPFCFAHRFGPVAR
jgi:AraC-like DNA-binding protein